MGQSKANKAYRTFVKGLITEASYLTYPEDSSFDELNTVLSRKGNRTRRFGINYNLNNFFARSYVNTDAKTEYLWNAVASQASLAFLVVQNGSTINFFNRSMGAFAANVKPFSIDLNLYTRPGVSNVRTMQCKFTSGKGYLFIVGPDIEPLVITYNRDTDTITTTKIAILARDFEGVQDGLQNAEEPSTLSSAHFYNLLNQGWVSTTTSSA